MQSPQDGDDVFNRLYQNQPATQPPDPSVPSGQSSGITQQSGDDVFNRLYQNQPATPVTSQPVSSGSGISSASLKTLLAAKPVLLLLIIVCSCAVLIVAVYIIPNGSSASSESLSPLNIFNGGLGGIGKPTIQARITYNGLWTGAITQADACADLDAFSRSTQKVYMEEGSKTITVENPNKCISFSFSKVGSDTETFKVEIFKNGQVIDKGSTTEPGEQLLFRLWDYVPG